MYGNRDISASPRPILKSLGILKSVDDPWIILMFFGGFRTTSLWVRAQGTAGYNRNINYRLQYRITLTTSLTIRCIFSASMNAINSITRHYRRSRRANRPISMNFHPVRNSGRILSINHRCQKIPPRPRWIDGTQKGPWSSRCLPSRSEFRSVYCSFLLQETLTAWYFLSLICQFEKIQQILKRRRADLSNNQGAAREDDQSFASVTVSILIYLLPVHWSKLDINWVIAKENKKLQAIQDAYKRSTKKKPASYFLEQIPEVSFSVLKQDAGGDLGRSELGSFP